MLQKEFGPEEDKVTEECKQLQNGEFYYLYAGLLFT
jgi:hypothetical protein